MGNDVVPLRKLGFRDRGNWNNELVHSYPDTIANHLLHSAVVDVVAVAVLLDR